MKKIYYNKLIRDNIPEVIHSLGKECETRKLSNEEFEKELIKKVGEEAIGLMNAKNRNEVIEELADVIDVIDEILKFKKISKKSIIEQQKVNLAKKGGFAKKLFIIWSSDETYKTNEKKGKVFNIKKQ